MVAKLPTHGTDLRTTKARDHTRTIVIYSGVSCGQNPGRIFGVDLISQQSQAHP